MHANARWIKWEMNGACAFQTLLPHERMPVRTRGTAVRSLEFPGLWREEDVHYGIGRGSADQDLTSVGLNHHIQGEVHVAKAAILLELCVRGRTVRMIPIPMAVLMQEIAGNEGKKEQQA